MSILKVMKINRILLGFNTLMFLYLSLRFHEWYYYYSVLLWSFCFILISITIKRYKQ